MTCNLTDCDRSALDAPKPATLDLLKVLRLWAARRRQRRTLARLEPRLLRDIGVGRAEALREAAKPFWRA